MLRSYRGILFAAFGFLVLLLGYASYQLYNASEQQHPNYHYQPASHQGRLVVPTGQPEAKGYQPNCYNPQGNSNADLCAQWAAVDQVTESNRLASVNVRLSLFVSLLTLLGTIFVGWTLMETRNTSRRELRAYVFAENSGVYALTKQVPRSENGKVGSTVVVRNSGQTPAYDVIHWSMLALHAVVNERELVIPPLETLHRTVVPPGGILKAERRLSIHLTRDQQASLKTGAMALYVYGRIEYTDAFGTRRYTDYRLAWAGWPLTDNISMTFCPEGNSAT